jgi:hypothetical protein
MKAHKHAPWWTAKKNILSNKKTNEQPGKNYNRSTDSMPSQLTFLSLAEENQK